MTNPMPSLSTVYKNTAGFAQTESATWGSPVTSAGGKTTWTATSANNGTVATLEIGADGSYTFTQSAPLVHASTSSTTEDNLSLAFNYTITDGDGDTVTGRLTVNIDDDTPTASTVTAATLLDDEAQMLFVGNAAGTGDVDNASVASGVAGTLFKAGADGLKTVTIASPPSLSTIYKDANGFAVVEAATWANPPLTSAGGVTTWTASSANNGTVATLVIGADGSYTFTQMKPLVHSTTSTTEDNRDLVFNFVVTDGDNDTASGSLTIRVNDDTPLAQDDTRTIDEDASATTLDLLANDSAGADGLRSVTLVGNPVFTAGATAPTGAGGTFSLSDAGILSFTPAANWNGTASVTYRLTDGDGDSIDRTATFTVNAVNDAPTAVTFTIGSAEVDGFTIAENTATGTVLGQAFGTDPDNATGLVYSLTNNAGGRFAIDPSTGVITVANGSLLNFETATSHSIVVRVTDPAGLFHEQTTTVNLTNVNETPVFGGEASGAVTEDGTLTAGGTLTVVDPDAGQSSFLAQTNALGTYGTFSITTQGVWTYTLSNTAPNVQALNAGQSPTDVFTVSSADGTNTSVTITVNGANEPVVVPAVTASDPGSYYAFTDNASSPNRIDLTYADLFAGETVGTTYGFTWLKSANNGNAINWLTVDSSGATGTPTNVDANSSGMSIARVSATTGGVTVTNYVAFVLLANEPFDGRFDAITNNVTGTNSAAAANFIAGDHITLSAGNYGTVASPVDAGGGDDIIRNLTGTGRAVIGGDGNDAMYGNTGNDTYSGGEGFDYLSGAGGNDSLSGNDGDDVLLGGAGNDTLSGGDDEDTLVGGDGNDSLSGGDEDDLLEGGAGNDILAGNDGEDVLLGGAGDDLLIGGDDNDTLTGGGGADRFRLDAPGDRTDRILDFGSDDVIELEGSQFGMGSFTGLLSSHSSIMDGAGTNDIFQVIASGGASATSAGRFLAVNQASGATSLYYDTNGNDAGGGTRVLLATLENGFDLSAEHIRIV
jgi:T1SS-143 domain-containing protein